jgi:triacylglycerol esterase/lipase EstA (alpha/beta hydrolase family)
MGEGLANEVYEFISEWCSGVAPTKISFVGHSMGGVIVRAALPHLASLRDHFHFFISLGTPHLGYMKTGSKIIDAGLWIIKSWSGSNSLRQLTYDDTQTIKSSALYDLSVIDGLQWFSHVFLICSH